MAETWPNTRGRRAFLKVADIVGRAAVVPFRRARKHPAAGLIQRILVMEPWNIGDVVLATPFLRALRRLYPGASISLLGKQHAQVILEGSGLVDEVIVCDLPWTASQNKYPLDSTTVRNIHALVRTLRSRNFDLTIDARMDIRSNLLAALARARQRVGYSIGGGGWLLNRCMRGDRRDYHKIEDWIDLLALLPGGAEVRFAADRVPFLSISETERANARRRLKEMGELSSPVIGYHPGGSHPAKRWPLAHFEKLIQELNDSPGGSHVVFLGPDDQEPDRLPLGVVVRRASLRDMMAEIACCDLLVCNDSGAMHIADALGVPVVAIFEIGNPQWYGPTGPRSTVIRGELAGLGISAAPLDRPPPRPVPIERVREAVKDSLRSAS